MATHTAPRAQLALTTDHAGQLVEVRGVIDLAVTGALATGDILRMATLPPKHRVSAVEVSTTAAMTSLAGDVGVLNAAGDDTGKEWFDAQALAAVQTTASTKPGRSNVVNASDADDQWIAIKITAGSAATSGKIILKVQHVKDRRDA